ncbi:MAG: murein biosynthesis integral membrane protein MurJ [Planctomycetaceae bacterium]|nr:murein biosynthesis integral membrane protein MurJ [Planctomycetaceae bacterium]
MFSGLRTVSAWTLISRILGLARDIGMATLFGGGALFDAFTVAFRIPNLARRLFGEGALTTAFLPAFVKERQQNGPDAAWQLTTAVLYTLAALLGGVVLVADLALGAVLATVSLSYETQLLVSLTAIMLPYLVLICLAAQISAVLNALEHFAVPALLPVALNVVWIAAIWGVCPFLESANQQIHTVAIAVVIGGVIQLALTWPKIRSYGFRWHPDWRAARGQVVSIGKAMMPILLGLSITQLNTLCDSLIAWGFSAPEKLTEARLWDRWDYPLQSGAASALFLGQRIYQFPLGVFGVALGTVLFPRFAMHADRQHLDQLRDDLTLGLKLILVIGVPASVGLVLLAEPLSALLFQYKSFDADDTAATSAMIAAYGLGVWAYCGLLIIQRAFYAVDDRETPMRIGLLAVVLNVTLNMVLTWPFGAKGLAISTAVSAIFQFLLTVWRFRNRLEGDFDWPSIGSTFGKTLLATTIMTIVCVAARNSIAADAVFWHRLLRVALPLLASIAVFAYAAKWLVIPEFFMLLKRKKTNDQASMTKG